ncbi:MAG: penicillin-binding transpeptidase domain-containing protein [Candidatus Marinimicrobia bacterium]|nr:penicillin-binding transpeptidase domain-containing protein [Candidatus Neomarinimicrobiota bacterium]
MARSYLMAILMISIFFIIVIKLIEIQLFDIYNYKNLAEIQTTNKEEILPERGIIFDRKNRILATNQIVYTLGARYIDISDPLTTFKQLGSHLNMSHSEIASIFENKRKYYVIKEDIPLSLASEIMKENLHGIRFEKKINRIYPYEETGGQVLGYVGWDNRGVSGIEKLYDESLCGEKGWEEIQVDRKGRRVSYSGKNRKEKKDGGNVFLTIDIDYQTILEEELQKAIKENNAKHGMGILVNPNTGEILGMASWPNFNPNQASSFPIENRKNRVISDSFEPGSVYKIVAAAAALETGVFTTNSLIYCEGGKWDFLGKTIHDTKKNEWLSFEDIIIHSSNIGIGKIAQQEGDDALYQMSKNLGFGEQTGLFPTMEISGNLNPVSEWGKISSSQVAMGHYVTTTLLQLAMAYSSVANNGLLMQPTLVRSAYSPNRELIESGSIEVVRRAMSESTASTLRSILEKAVNEGTGQKAYIKGYRVAGKTGTAQKVIDGKYSDQYYISSFIGFFPANKPVLVCGITLDSPAYGKHWGGTCAAPAVKNIFTRIINTTDFNNLYEWVQPVEDVLAENDDPNYALPYQFSASLGTGNTSSSKNSEPQLPASQSQSITQQETTHEMEIQVLVPNVKNMSVKNAQHILSKLSLNYEIKGTDNLVIDQIPLPGESLSRGSVCLLITGKKRNETP